MILEFFAIDGHQYDLRANSPKRDWMDKTDKTFAYRCLPLVIANSHGWSFHLMQDLKVLWGGGNGVESIRFDRPDQSKKICTSAFGYGILTFYIHGLFRTSPGWNLMIGGSANFPTDGIYPLTGVVETDWSPYTFTMNWKITRPNHWITFQKGDPFCSIFPVERHCLQSVEPHYRTLSDDPKLKADHEAWSQSRSDFNRDLKIPGSAAHQQKWQKNYFRGKNLQDVNGTDHHLTSLRLKEFAPPPP
jgi:hypothetical protein